MAHHEEPMDVDCMDGDFDNKENTYNHSNVLPCTEKGYEELDVSELNMKLRYSITPVASPMSKSFTAYVDNRHLDSDDSLNCANENANLTRSLNCEFTKNDSVIKSLKTLPLQTISTEQIDENSGSVLRQLDSTITGNDNNVTITINQANEINENLSLPSSSSSAIHTPEATTPTNLNKNEEGSPIIRGLKSVFNMFRSSQSPIPPVENDISVQQAEKALDLDETYCEDQKPQTLASTPISAHRSNDGSSKRSSPLKDSIIFNDDLEKEIQWKDETILFSEEKIPIHKLFLPQNKTGPVVVTATPQKDQKKLAVDNMDSTVEYMDVSHNSSMTLDNTLTEIHNNTNTVESDGEFVDCETTFTKNESLNIERLEKTLELLTDEIVNENVSKVHKSEEKNEVQNDIEFKPQILDITREILIENFATLNETVESKENLNIPVSDADITLNATKGIIFNVTEINGNVTINNEIQEEPLDAVQTFEEYLNKNISHLDKGSNDIEIQKEPSPDTVKTLDDTMEIQDNKVLSVTECGIPEATDTPVIDLVLAENNVSLPSNSIKILTDILLEQKADDIQHDVILPDIKNKSLHEENLTNESIVENINVSNEINQGEISFEIYNKKACPAKEINVEQLIENEKTCKEIKETKSICYEPEIEILPDKVTNIVLLLNASKDTQAFENNMQDTKTDYAEQSACPSEFKANNTINVSLMSVPEHIIQIEQQARCDDAKSKDVLPPPCGMLSEEPANIPLPDNDDFDIDLEHNENKMETIQAIPPDVLDSVIPELKLDGTEIQIEVVDDTNINENTIAELNGLSEKQDILNETNYIVNSLTEMIGESQNNTTTQSMCLLEPSQNCPMEDIEFTDEIHMLPDLVNQTIHNMSVDSGNMPAILNQSQPGHSIESVAVGEPHCCPNVPETIPNDKKEKPLSETLGTSVVKVTTEQNNESINANKEHTDAIVIPSENVDTVPKTNQNDLAYNETENALKENKVLDLEFVPNTEVNEVPIVDKELVFSENNSPYVSVIAETTTKSTEEHFESINIPLTATNEAPSSPPIRSKGYNFNFDEMDDPFATKAKIRQSPPPTSSKVIEPDNNFKTKPGASKKVAPNRRRSQPPERKRLTIKKKFNTTIDTCSATEPRNNKSNDQISEVDTIMATNNTMDLNSEVDKEVATILDSTQVFDKTVDLSPENDHSNFQPDELFTPATDVETSAVNKSSIESMSTATSEIKTNSSSEQSTYYSAVASSSDSSISKNVFNLPEIDDKNFNLFASKSKTRQSPPLDFECENPFATKSKMRSSPDSSTLPNLESTQNIVIKYAEDKMDTELMEKDSSYSVNNITSSSKGTDDKNITIREVNTEDEDTEEGPFLEAEDAIDKLLSIDNDMMQFNEIPAQATDENVDSGEMFIDAEAFEFLLNQNKSNVVTDSGKESLFLKFDPLFAKRMSSDLGLLAALNKVQKRQSTPTKPTRPSLRNEASPIAGPSTLNATYDEETNVTEDSIEDLNVTVAKPTMVVTPAVNPAITPRNKTTTPPRSNRRSITFTSPAMAVIDRLLSLSGNNSLLGQDTTSTQASREHIEADLALTQLRELLAEKEISVYQLRSDSKELKDRLSTMETQIKILEADGQERLKKINDLTDRLAEKTRVNKSMAAVVEEYERTIASLIAETEQDKKRHAEERIRLINERDEQTAHLASMEVSFSDLHSKYEKSKQVILSCKANEETCKKSIKDFEVNLAKMQTNYEMLKQHATSKLNHANQELQKINKAHESEVLKLNAMIKRKDMHITSLEETLAQKTKANEELTAICDELINKVG